MAKTRAAPKRTLLTCETIGKLADGTFELAVNKELDELFADLKNRGHDMKARSLTIEVTFKPGKGGTTMVIDPRVKKKLPPREPHSTFAKMDVEAGALVFNPESAENPDQMNFDDLPQENPQ
jgi:hypothetical protein